MANWIGYSVSIRCADNLGSYQGEISCATNEQIVLTKAFCDGIPCTDSTVTILASDIADLKLIEKKEANNSVAEASVVTIAKPIPKRAARTHTVSESAAINCNGKLQNVNPQQHQHQRSKPIDIQQQLSERTGNGAVDFQCGSFKSVPTPNRRDKNKTKLSKRDDECFGSPLDQSIGKDFDFEKNLALFDKQAIWQQIKESSNSKPDVIRHADVPRKKVQSYRHDENIIEAMPTMFRHIHVPDSKSNYVTDDGLLVPTIDIMRRDQLWAAADRAGITWGRRLQLMGRAVVEMALQLVGGAHRLNPHNLHQQPTVLFLCGVNRQGAVAVNAAHQLASHSVQTVVYIRTDLDSTGLNRPPEYLRHELDIYRLTGMPLVQRIDAIPANADLTILGLCEESDDDKLMTSSCLKELKSLTEVVRNNPIIAIDPPTMGIPGFDVKLSLVPVLPLSYETKNGRIYLCNLGFPTDVFTQAGITYRSPFGAKFVIPIHTND